VTTAPNSGARPLEAQGFRRRVRWALVASVMLLVFGIGASLFVLGRQRPAPCATLCSALGAERGDRAQRARGACQSSSESQCCSALVPLALDLGLHEAALGALDSMGGRCADSAGMRAEALAGTGKTKSAQELAGRALATRPEDRYAAMALAMTLEQQGSKRTGVEQANKALLLGRGVPAQVLLGNLHLELGRLDTAEQEFRRVVELDAENAPARLGLARIADLRGHYHDAREGYFDALRLRPDYVEARYLLAKLVYRAGARAEAEHHLEKLRAVAAPGDARLQELEQTLSASRASRLAAPQER
jgi:tetratricopeptide (TPR) repeat protein